MSNAGPNPYQSPLGAAGPAPAVSVGANDWVFREGKTVVAHKHSRFPNVCFVTGDPVETTLTRNFAWHPQWVAVLVLVAIPVYIIVALLMTKRATFILPLSHRAVSTSWKRVFLAWGVFVLGSATCIGLGIALSETGVFPRESPAGFLLAFFGTVACIITGAVIGQFSTIAGCSKINGDFVWITGAGPGFLQHLPEKPPQIV